jgi:HEAT repeat protein
MSLEEKGVDTVDIVDEVTRPMRAEDMEMWRLAWSLEQAGATQAALEGLVSGDPARRRISARFVGALQMEDAVPWLAPLALSSDRTVCDAAARALGRIGGSRSAQALLAAIQRNGARRILITALARAAPDLFLEVALSEPHPPGVTQAVAIAAGLRRRHTAIGPLLALLVHGSRRERASACRALGWIGAGTASPLLIGALEHPDWKVRISAAKALAALRAPLAAPDLERLLSDPNPRVRRTAHLAGRRCVEILPMRSA